MLKSLLEVVRVETLSHPYLNLLLLHFDQESLHTYVTYWTVLKNEFLQDSYSPQLIDVESPL
jgi:hypothetical protein